MLQAISGASGERLSGPGPPCSRHIRTNGSARSLGHLGWATATIEESCGRRSRRSARTCTRKLLRLHQAVVRLDGQYGNGAIVADLDGLAYVMRGKDYDLLDLPEVQARLAQPPDQQTTHSETGTCRALFDFPDLRLSPTGPRARVILAAHQAALTKAPVGTTRGEEVYELFYTALPAEACTPADVLNLYLHRGAFECVLADEDEEQDLDRWCSHTAWGQEFWLILAQWIWNVRLELGHALHPTPMRTTEFAPASAGESAETTSDPALRPVSTSSCHLWTAAVGTSIVH